MTECASIRGQWGGLCPDCGQRLPNPGPLASWKSQRPLAFPSGSSAGLGTRQSSRTPRAPLDPPGLTGHQRRVLAVLRACRGNRSRAARALGIQPQTVQSTVRLLVRLGAIVPAGARRGPDLRQRVRT